MMMQDNNHLLDKAVMMKEEVHLAKKHQVQMVEENHNHHKKSYLKNRWMKKSSI